MLPASQNVRIDDYPQNNGDFNSKYANRLESQRFVAFCGVARLQGASSEGLASGLHSVDQACSYQSISQWRLHLQSYNFRDPYAAQQSILQLQDS